MCLDYVLNERSKSITGHGHSTLCRIIGFIAYNPLFACTTLDTGNQIKPRPIPFDAKHHRPPADPSRIHRLPLPS